MSTQWKRRITFGLGAMLTLLAATPGRAQDAGTNDLETQLKKDYKLSVLGFDSGGVSIVQPGTVFVIQKGGVLGVPPVNPKIGHSTYQDDRVQGPSGAARVLLGQATRLLGQGEKVYVTKIEVVPKKDKVVLTIIECDSCNQVQQPSLYKAAIDIQFPKDYLSAADPGQVEGVINQVLAPDKPSHPEQAQAQTPDPPPAPKPADLIGKTPEQVEAVIGPPDKKVIGSPKTVYVYYNLRMTVVFVNRKAAEAD